MKYHVAVKHDETFKCQYCGKCFKSIGSLNNHQKRKSCSAFKCEVCDSSFKSENALGKHYELSHNETYLFECEKCGKSFAQKGEFDKHAASHKKVYKKCGESFPILPKHSAKHKDGTTN